MIIHKIIKWKPRLPVIVLPQTERRIPGEFPYKTPVTQNQQKVDHKSGLDYSGWVSPPKAPPSVRNQEEYDKYLQANNHLGPGTLLVHRNTTKVNTALQVLFVLRIIPQYSDVRNFHNKTGNPYSIITASLSKLNFGTASIPPAHVGEDCLDNYRTLTQSEMSEVIDDRVSNHIKAIKTYFGQQ